MGDSAVLRGAVIGIDGFRWTENAKASTDNNVKSGVARAIPCSRPSLLPVLLPGCPAVFLVSPLLVLPARAHSPASVSHSFLTSLHDTPLAAAALPLPLPFPLLLAVIAADVQQLSGA